MTPFFEFRQYWKNGTYRAGVALVPDNGFQIENFPERLLDYWPSTPLHYENGVSKNNTTGRRFKGIVRILKRLLIEMDEAGHNAAKSVPGYLLECMSWNVPDSAFVLLHLWSNTKADAQCKSWCYGRLVRSSASLYFLAGDLNGSCGIWYGWFVRRPDLRGTWRVELQSDWVDPATQEKVPTIVCYMGVVQSLSRLQMHLMTKESESWFIAESVTPSPNCIGYQIAGVYTNKPHTHLRGDRSEIHLGGLILNTHGRANRPETLMGEYWTDRKTKAHLTLSARMPKVLTRFEDAEASVPRETGCSGVRP